MACGYFLDRFAYESGLSLLFYSFRREKKWSEGWRLKGGLFPIFILVFRGCYLSRFYTKPPT